jgi:hypothetical protein
MGQSPHVLCSNAPKGAFGLAAVSALDRTDAQNRAGGEDVEVQWILGGREQRAPV